MGALQGLLDKLGLGDFLAPREPLRIFLLDDDVLRHEWFARQFKGDSLDVAVDPTEAIALLSKESYDLIFLDHDLLPEHYHAEVRDDARTGYAVALWLAEQPAKQPAATVVVHTRNAEGAFRMVELLRRAGRQAEHIPYTILPTKIKGLRQRR
jgi:CheY-like chemotaxis protein